MSFDINITVNGNRCKQYQHQGKTFIEAKNGSEYVIEIKNSYWRRILAVCSVDGLNILTGKKASPEDTGYLVGSYAAEKIKGFRFSDDAWAMFKFGYKFDGKTYAQSKGDGSEQNCGVIGVRLFYEQEIYNYNSNNLIGNITNNNSGNNSGNIQWLNYSGGAVAAGGYSAESYTNTVNNVSSDDASMDFMGCNDEHNPTKSSKSRKLNAKPISAGVKTNYFCNSIPKVEPNFDMGTEWGRKEQSKVQNVTFERGSLARSIDIYYASRESLIAMGVPIENKLQANLPQSFPNEYAKPPQGWQG